MGKVIKFNRLNIKTYNPKERFEIKEHALPMGIRLWHLVLSLGGFLFLFFSGLILGIKAFFGAKRKIEDISARKSRVIDLRGRGIYKDI